MTRSDADVKLALAKSRRAKDRMALLLKIRTRKYPVGTHGSASAARKTLGTTGAQQQHLAPRQADAGIELDVIDQANAVGVVRFNADMAETQGVGGLGQLRTLRGCAGHVESFKLERHGHIAATGAAGDPMLQRA